MDTARVNAGAGGRVEPAMADEWKRGDLCRVPDYPDAIFMYLRPTPHEPGMVDLAEALGPLPADPDATPDYRERLSRLRRVDITQAKRVLVQTEERLATLSDELGYQITHLRRWIEESRKP